MTHFEEVATGKTHREFNHGGVSRKRSLSSHLAGRIPSSDVFRGHRGELRRHYQVGQENQLDSLGIMVNLVCLWNTVYTQAALDHLRANGYQPDPADLARLTPLGHPSINLNGRYRTTGRPPATGLRSLRTD